MLINALGDPSFFPLLRRTGRYLLESQGPKGSWNYTVKLPANVPADPDSGKVLVVSGGRPLDGSVDRRNVLARISDQSAGTDGDNSVTQYAVLGLRAVATSGLQVQSATWKGILNAYSHRQNEDGGWGYTTGPSYGSMTCAGTASVALALSYLGEKHPEKDARVARGLAWLENHWSIREASQMTIAEDDSFWSSDKVF